MKLSKARTSLTPETEAQTLRYALECVVEYLAQFEDCQKGNDERAWNMLQQCQQVLSGELRL